MMKNLYFIFSVCLLLSFCKTKKNSTDAANTKKGTEAKSPNATLAIAQKRWPGTTDADLAEGKQIYETKCTTCHGAKNIVTRDEQNWVKSIDKMAPKAKLSAEEKEKLSRYILSYREAHTTTD